ncbi:MAG TPA: protein translocase subunit SecF, partial [Bacilli bacterium]
ASVLTIGGENDNRISSRFDKVLTENERIKIIDAFSEKYNNGETVDFEENTVDPGMAKELGIKAIWAVFYAALGLGVYVSLRFEWRFAVVVVITMIHDAFFVITLFSIFRLEVNLPFLAAILTIIGYSINDKIVIFDRIRENLRFAKLKTFADLCELVNRSIRQTMTRSINTVLMVLIAAICLFIFGSEAIKLFSLAMILGLISGVYSSIFIASQIWLLIKNQSLNSKKAAITKEQVN